MQSVCENNEVSVPKFVRQCGGYWAVGLGCWLWCWEYGKGGTEGLGYYR